MQTYDIFCRAFAKKPVKRKRGVGHYLTGTKVQSLAVRWRRELGPQVCAGKLLLSVAEMLKIESNCREEICEDF
jgi:hypothetical protein